MTVLGKSSTESQQPAVEFRDVHVVFAHRLRKPVHALRGLSLKVPRGAIMGLLGPNGSGKTTAFSCLQGLLSPRLGRVFVGGEDQDHPRACGVLLEDTRLPPFLPVREALELSCRLRGLSGTAAARESRRVIELLRIGDLLDRRAAVLSKGQARRVGLATALIGDPPLLILDEPSAGMDVETRVEFEGLLRELNDGKRTVLVASHLLSDVQNTCTHVAIMRHGRVVTVGAVADLLECSGSAATSDIHVSVSHADLLEKLALSFGDSRYSGAVVLKTELPDAEVLSKLLAAGVVPLRVEPRTDLASIYLNSTESEEQP